MRDGGWVGCEREDEKSRLSRGSRVTSMSVYSQLVTHQHKE